MSGDQSAGLQGPLESGQKVGFGRYTLTRFLGKGGMGVVWLARDDRLEEELALKFLAGEISHDAEALADMRRETLKSRKLSHPNIIRIHDLFEGEGELPFISMEFIDGKALNTFKAEQPHRLFSWGYLMPLVRQLCAALDYAHGQKIIHRDLKPGNMMVDATGALKLADFGLAASAADSMSRLSKDLGSSGTPAYMSPQQMRGQPPKVADDIYSLGATLYELLTSKPPFYTGDIPYQVREEAPTPMDERLAHLELDNPIPADVAALVMACLAKQPEQRPPSAAAVAEWIGLEIHPLGSVSALSVPAEAVAVDEEAVTVPDYSAELAEATPEALDAELAPQQGNGVDRRWGAIAAFLTIAALALAIFVPQGNRGKPTTPAKSITSKTKIALMAGEQGHKLGQHEWNAAAALIEEYLEKAYKGVDCVPYYYRQWPKDLNELTDSAAIVVIDSGGGEHPVAQRLKEFRPLMDKGIGFACLHYAVEIPKGDAGDAFRDWLGGHFETFWSVNPIWEAEFKTFPDHPIARGVKPFKINDEWYFNMRFRDGMRDVTPILSAVAPADTMKRGDGPHSGNPHARKAVTAKEPQRLAWATERDNGGRGFGFTGMHFNANWADDNFRKTILNGIAWTAKLPIPANGVESKALTKEQLHTLATVFENTSKEALKRDIALAARLGESSANPSRPIQTFDLLALTDPVKDRIPGVGKFAGGSNLWIKAEGALSFRADGKSGKIAAPVAMAARSYEIEVAFTRTAVNTGFHIDLPLRSDLIVPLAIGQDRTKLVLEHVTIGNIPSLASMLNGRVVARVEPTGGVDSKVVVMINGQMAGSWSGDLESIGKTVNEPHPEFPNVPYTSIWCRESPYEFTDWTLRIFDGQAKTLR